MPCSALPGPEGAGERLGRGRAKTGEKGFPRGCPCEKDRKTPLADNANHRGKVGFFAKSGTNAGFSLKKRAIIFLEK